MPSSNTTSLCHITHSHSPRALSTCTFSATAPQIDLSAPGASDHWSIADGAGAADAALERANIGHLCTTMLWLRSWWQSHQDAVRAVDSKAAAEVHDHFIDGAIFARGTARGMMLDLDEKRIGNYRWGKSAQTLRLVVAMPAVNAGSAS